MSETPEVKLQIDTPIPPSKEWMVREIFVLLHKKLGYEILKTQEAFPDYILLDADGRRIRAEVEIYSRDFKKHGHPSEECDLIICWEHNWEDCPVPILRLSEFVIATFPRFQKEELQGISNLLEQYKHFGKTLSKRNKLIGDVNRFVMERRAEADLRDFGDHSGGSYGSYYSYEDWANYHSSLCIDFEKEKVGISGWFYPTNTKKKPDIQEWGEILTELRKNNFSFKRKLVEVEEEVVDRRKLLKELKDIPDKIEHTDFSRINDLSSLCAEPTDIVDDLGNTVLWILDFLKKKGLYSLEE